MQSGLLMKDAIMLIIKPISVDSNENISNQFFEWIPDTSQ